MPFYTDTRTDSVSTIIKTPTIPPSYTRVYPHKFTCIVLFNHNSVFQNSHFSLRLNQSPPSLPTSVSLTYIDAYTTFENERDSKLPKRKVAAALRSLNIPVTDAEVTQYLANIQGLSIDLATFKQIVLQASAVPRSSLAATIQNAASLFKTEDGKINLQDLKQVLVVVGEKLDDDDLDDFLGQATVDANGYITVSELESLFKK